MFGGIFILQNEGKQPDDADSRAWPKLVQG